MSQPDPDRYTQTLQLPDGRTLGYATFGDVTGSPVLYHHGWPGSRLDITALDSIATEAGVRIISPDRPGFGLSTHLPDRTLLEWPVDIAQLMDSLDVDRFAVLGLSGGGPSALATAHRLPHRVTTTAMVSAWGPMGRRKLLKGEPWSDRVVLELAAKAPWANRPYTGLMAMLVRRLSEKRLLKMVAGSLSVSDNELLQAKPDLGSSLVKTAREAFRRGGGGAEADVRVTAQPWHFDPDTLTGPVHFWHGGDDPAVPTNISEVLSAEIPGASLHIYPGEGHLAIYRHAREIFSDLG